MKKQQNLTSDWKAIKNFFEKNTNGFEVDKKNYGKNFPIGGTLDQVTQDFLGRLKALTEEKGHDAVVEGYSLDVWKERVWGVVEKAGLLEPLPKKKKSSMKKAS